jgi:hypothetical protein
MLRPTPIEPAPPETVWVARAALPKGQRYPRLGDVLETLFTDNAFLTIIVFDFAPLLVQPVCFLQDFLLPSILGL